MSKITWKGSTLLAPIPACMVSCGTKEKANIVTVAWTGIVNTHPPKVYISLRPTRHSYAIIRESGEFVINLTTAALARTTDFCGIHTGKKIDKFARCGLTMEKASTLSCPLIAESPLSLECRVTDVIPLGTHDMFLADVVEVDLDESLLDANGKLCLDRADLLAFAHGEYFSLGKKLGSFGFSVKKKKPHRHPPANTKKMS